MIDPVPAAVASVATGGRDPMASRPRRARRAPGIRWATRLVPWLWSIWLAGVLVLIGPADRGKPGFGAARPAIVGCS